MSIYMLDHRLWFPDPGKSEKRGIVAVGGDLSVERLVLAYRSGIFPWYGAGEPLVWWSPDPRFVLHPKRFRLFRSLRKTLAKERFEIRFDSCFDRVIRACAKIPRTGQPGTWIHPEMILAYEKLHQAGWAHSLETFADGELVGGLYGVAMGPFFFGESMFFHQPDASKVALAALAARYSRGGVIDCQMHTPFFERHGAEFIPRDDFLNLLRPRADEPSMWFQGGVQPIQGKDVLGILENDESP